MAASVDQAARVARATGRPLWLSILAGFSLLLGIVTFIPQLYYVLFALHLVPIGPNTNPLGEVWYDFILNGDSVYRKVDPGFLAGAVEDVFMLGPLYIATGVGLWLRRPWVVPVGLMTGATIFYAIVGLVLGDVFAGLPTVTNPVSYWASNLPYFIYPLWLVPVLLFRRSLFMRKTLERSEVARPVAVAGQQEED